MKNSIIAILTLIIVILAGALAYVTLVKLPAAENNLLVNEPIKTETAELPATCIDEAEAAPVITSLSAYSGPVGTKLEIRGCNFQGFEGDLTAWIENTDGITGVLYGEEGSDDKLLKITLKSPLCQDDLSYKGTPCEDFLTLEPGTYSIYTEPWAERSNEATFTIK